MHRGMQQARRTVFVLPGVVAALVGLAVAVAALRVLAAVAMRGTGAPAGAARPDDVLVLLLAWVGVTLAGWLALGSLLALAAAFPGTAGRVAADLAERITPAAARKALTLVLGASVGSVALPPSQVSSADSSPVSAGSTRWPAPGASVGTSALGPAFVPGGPAAAVPRPGYVPTGVLATAVPSGEHLPPPSDGLGETGAAALAPGFVPTPNRQSEASADGGEGPGYVPSAPRPVLAADRSRLLAPSPRPTAGTHDVVTVHRGDTLWAVAARHLGPDAADAQVAREWPRWYAVNRDVIGDDPDLLVPGQQLRPPSDPAHAPSIERTATAPVERGAHR